MNDKPIFDEEYVDCNTCESYWVNQCDGTNKQRNCTAYKAVKRMDIPKQIDDINQQMNALRGVITIQGITILIVLVRLML